MKAPDAQVEPPSSYLPFLLGGVVVLFTLGMIYWVGRQTKKNVEDHPAAAAPPAKSARESAPTSSSTAAASSSGRPFDPVSGTATAQDEAKIQAWLTESASTDAAADAFLAGWAQLTEAGKVAAAPHLANLVPDSKYDPVARMLLDSPTNNGVKHVLFADLLNRPDPLKWPLLLSLMEQKDHPLAQEARNVLSVVLGTDAGDDWPRWRELMRNKLPNLPHP